MNEVIIHSGIGLLSICSLQSHFLQQCCFNSLRPRQNRWHFADDVFKCNFLNENVWIPIKISLKGPIDNIPTLVQIMAWHRSGDKPLSEPMTISSLTHICVTRPQWVNKNQTLMTKLQWYFNQNIAIFIQENVTCKTPALFLNMLKQWWHAEWNRLFSPPAP